MSPLSHTLWSREKRKWSPTKGALNCWTNSPYQHLRKCIENSKENMHTDVTCSFQKSFLNFQVERLCHRTQKIVGSQAKTGIWCTKIQQGLQWKKDNQLYLKVIFYSYYECLVVWSKQNTGKDKSTSKLFLISKRVVHYQWQWMYENHICALRIEKWF